MIKDRVMWDNFVPVWEGLRATRFPPVLVGGYGLFLKQEWAHNGEHPPNHTVVDTDRWSRENARPRVTEDYDLAIDVDIITPAPEEGDPQEEIVEVLRRNEFNYEHEVTVEVYSAEEGEPTQLKLSFDHRPDEDEIKDKLVKEKPEFSFKSTERIAKEKWRWLKLVEGNSITVKTEFMSVGYQERPNAVRQGPKRIRRRSKSRNLIEAHLHPELKGLETTTGHFLFIHKGVQIAVPNPMTWAVMKLNATGEKRGQATRSDQDWVDSGYDSSPEQDTQDRLDRLTEKHAEDLWRIMAMVTRSEADGITEELKTAIREGEKYKNAQAYLNEHFIPEGGYGVQIARRDWEQGDIAIMQALLSRWFA